jgi:hypothetical protein
VCIIGQHRPLLGPGAVEDCRGAPNGRLAVQELVQELAGRLQPLDLPGPYSLARLITIQLPYKQFALTFTCAAAARPLADAGAQARPRSVAPAQCGTRPAAVRPFPRPTSRARLCSNSLASQTSRDPRARIFLRLREGPRAGGPSRSRAARGSPPRPTPVPNPSPAPHKVHHPPAGVVYTGEAAVLFLLPAPPRKSIHPPGRGATDCARTYPGRA